MRRRNELTVARLREVLSYNPETGAFTWLVALSRRMPAGYPAGSRRHDGYIRIRIDGTDHLAHRLAWLHMTGDWPAKQEIDHRNGIPSDNRWINLREATPSENQQNKGRPRNNTTGFKGVSAFNAHPVAKPYQAKIYIGGKLNFLGYFATPEEAHAAYCKAATEFHGDFARVA